MRNHDCTTRQFELQYGSITVGVRLITVPSQAEEYSDRVEAETAESAVDMEAAASIDPQYTLV